MKKLIIVAIACAISQAVPAAEYVPTGRYSNTKLAPEVGQKKPLQMNIEVSFPPYVLTVGDAVKYVLGPTGYMLPTDEEWLDPAFITVGRKKLPVSQKRMHGTVTTVLLTLVGQNFVLVHDDVNRLVSMDYVNE